MYPSNIKSSQMWSQYFESASFHDAGCVNNALLEERVQANASDLFTTDEDDDLHIRITDLSQNDPNTYSQNYTTESEIAAALKRGRAEGAHTRIISIYTMDSISPLMITCELMGLLLRTHDIHPYFLHILLSFCGRVRTSVAGGTGAMISSPAGQDYYTIYQLDYVEENCRRANPWSYRRTGVYHHHTSDGDLFILLHPNEDSKFDTSLLQVFGVDRNKRSQITKSPGGNIPVTQIPSLVHSSLLSSFVDNWRWYLRFLAGRFETANNEALTTRPDETTSSESHDKVAQLRNLNDYACMALVCCKSNLDIIQRLKSTASNPGSAYDIFESTISRCIERCEGLLPRIQNTTDMIGYTLTLRNQLDAARVSIELRDLTAKLQGVTSELKDLQKLSVDDSAVVKIVTVMSAVYLPGTFIVSFYGMNFFVFDEQTRHIVIAKDFWIFLATWLPLTLITMAVYVLIVYFDRWWKGKPFQLFKRPQARNIEAEEQQDSHQVEFPQKIG